MSNWGFREDGVGQLWWLTFTDNGAFKGVCIVEALSPSGAHNKVNEKGLNPGGAIKGARVPIEVETLLLPFQDRLLDMAQVVFLANKINEIAVNLGIENE